MRNQYTKNLSLRPQRIFSNSEDHQNRQSFRRLLKKTKAFNHNERVVAEAILNMWFHNWNTAGFIYPGREKLAKQTNLSVRTIASYLKKFREIGFILAIRHAKGGRNSTRYIVDLEALHEFLCPPPVVVNGDLQEIEQASSIKKQPVRQSLKLVVGGKIARCVGKINRANFSHGKSIINICLSQFKRELSIQERKKSYYTRKSFFISPLLSFFTSFNAANGTHAYEVAV